MPVNRAFLVLYNYYLDINTTVSTWHEEIRLIPISSAGSLIGLQEHIH